MTIESKIIKIKAESAEGRKQYVDPISATYKRILAEERSSRFAEFQ